MITGNSIDVKTTPPDLSQLIKRTTTSQEIITLTDENEGSAVLMSQAAFEYLIGAREAKQREPMDPDEFEQQFHQALVEAGYDTKEKIVELVQDVKREMYEERVQRRQSSASR